MRTGRLLLAIGLLLAGRLAADPVAAPSAGTPVAGPADGGATRPAAGSTLAAGATGDPAADAPAKPDTMLYPRTAESVGPGRAPAASFGGPSAMLLVLGLGAAAGWLLWRKLRGVRQIPGGAQKLAIAETRSLGNRQFLVVAAYGERKFLLGVCPGRIDLLSPLEGGQPPSP